MSSKPRLTIVSNDAPWWRVAYWNWCVVERDWRTEGSGEMWGMETVTYEAAVDCGHLTCRLREPSDHEADEFEQRAGGFQGLQDSGPNRVRGLAPSAVLGVVPDLLDMPSDFPASALPPFPFPRRYRLLPSCCCQR